MPAESADALDWRARLLWGGLALAVALVAVLLTWAITRVDRTPHAAIRVVFDERPPLNLNLSKVSLQAVERARYRIPALVYASPRDAVFVVTPATRSVAVENVDPRDAECRYAPRAVYGTAVAVSAGLPRSSSAIPLPPTAGASGGMFLAVPADLRAAAARVQGGRGAIACTIGHRLAAAPTFTERSLTLSVRNRFGGMVIVDVSALEDIDNLRFSGGVMLPFAGDRTRLLEASDDTVSMEWIDVAAAERRDVILVMVGGLAAVAAAMAIEAIRPFIER